jgi:proteasome lid subunit RPN8/RPN11
LTKTAIGGRLVLPAALRAEIVAHAQEAAPHEACGLIAGREGRATRVIRCPNLADDPLRRYVMAPLAVMQALRSMTEAGETGADGTEGEPLAIYHSHVYSGPYPSPTDRAEARWPSSFYVLVSVRSDVPEVSAYRIDADHPGSEKTVKEAELVEA